ncbi:VanZ family protein [Streptomyces guryensis]|uniref:VanZ family protein n=1 Tax=Streptomyces guryensis TaxID=2886947 RepID=A0A9Q3VIQ8_9ACTN|nr:VanZ family protein [Streptomyces guryensis]MCD9874443.1 VanZ family protein [Streptomyces guryensis]
MGRAALRPRAALRLRTTKTGTSEKPKKLKKAEKPQKPEKSKPEKSKKPGSKSRPAPRERHVLALPIRLLAMLCAFVFMVAFAAVLARLTLEPSPASVAMAHTNLHPGSTLRAYLDQPALKDAVKQIGGNVLLGVPFGVLVPVVAPRTRGLLRVLILTAVVMLLVEFAQGALIEGRAFDIDDVILNTTGALIGYVLLGRRLSRAVHAREKLPRREAKRAKGA